MTDKEKLEQVALMTFELFADARTMVPEHGNGYKKVYRRLNVKGWGHKLTDIILLIEPVPACLAENEDCHYLVLAAYCLPIEYKVNRILKRAGSKHEIMEYLKCKELQDRILAAIPTMAESFDDL